MGRTKHIRKAVERKLHHDPVVDAADVVVRNLDGKVALTGTVPSYPQCLRAARLARQVPGVTAVHNHLGVVLPPQDHRDDAELASAANTALAASGSAQGRARVPEGVKAIAKDGNLVLTGTVRFSSQRSAAEAAVGGLTGVRHVKDEIEVVFDADYHRVKPLIVQALHELGLPRTAVTLDVKGNTAILIGRVRTQHERDAVVGAAARAPDVMAVLDEIQITG